MADASLTPVTRFGLIPRRPGMTLEQFQAHYRDIHGPLGAQMPGLLRYWQNHRIAPPRGPALPWPGFDACSELDAESVEAHLEMARSPIVRGAIAEDEPKLLDMPKRSIAWTRRVVAKDEIGAGVRLLTFIRRSPSRAQSELAAVLQADERRGEGARGRELLLALERLPDGVVSSFDAVEALWFHDVADASDYLDSGRAERDRMAIAGVATATERLLADVNLVV
ncbi:MAG TPA: EthD domain-containing protein [Solirubrobacteraceae bacterium]|nr:EthD domain-containing protein [Solirubrobacteraceae bacterium]